MQFAGLGMELSATTLGLAGIGYLVDTVRGHQTLYATATGVLVGFAFGMFRFIQKASGSITDASKRDKKP
jgi:F0F1-type ATP synthase assembly protein I